MRQLFHRLTLAHPAVYITFQMRTIKSAEVRVLFGNIQLLVFSLVVSPRQLRAYNTLKRHLGYFSFHLSLSGGCPGQNSSPFFSMLGV